MTDWDVMQSGYSDDQIYSDSLSDFMFELMLKPLYSKRVGHERIKAGAPKHAEFYDACGDYFLDDIAGRSKYSKLTKSWDLIPEYDFWGKLTRL